MDEYINREIGMQFGGWMCVVKCVGVENATRTHKPHTTRTQIAYLYSYATLSWSQTNKCEIRTRMNEMYAK